MRYINLMQARYGEGRLKLRVDLDPATLDSRVPPFILQPLLENCIKHAMRETEPLSIVLSSVETDDGVQIVVEDDGIGMSRETIAHLFDVKRVTGSQVGEAEGQDGGRRRDAPHHGGRFHQARGAGWRSPTCSCASIFFGEESGIRVESQEGVGTRVVVELVGEPHEPEGSALPSAQA